jgi:hypothetical protein
VKSSLDDALISRRGAIVPILFPSLGEVGILGILAASKSCKISRSSTYYGFDSHTLPPYPSDVTDVTEKRGGRRRHYGKFIRFCAQFSAARVTTGRENLGPRLVQPRRRSDAQTAITALVGRTIRFIVAFDERG